MTLLLVRNFLFDTWKKNYNFKTGIITRKFSLRCTQSLKLGFLSINTAYYVPHLHTGTIVILCLPINTVGDLFRLEIRGSESIE